MNNVNSSQETFLELLIPEETIIDRIIEIAETLDRDYQGRQPFIIAILKGSICLVADLIRHLQCSYSIEFIRCSSYGASGHLRGRLRISGLDQFEVEGKDVLIIDDIFDSGNTLTAVH